MGLFTTKDGDISIAKIAGAGVLGVTGILAGLDSFYIVEAREVALKVRFGDVAQVDTTPGIRMKLPILDGIIKYPLYRQRTEVLAEDANLRTRDQMRVEGGIYVDYEIDEQSANIQTIYADLRGDGGDISDVIRMRAKEASVRAFGEFSSVELTTKIADITQRAKEILQESIDEQGWPFHIKDVISNGVRLSPDSEAKLEGVMAAEQERIILELRDRNASLAQGVLQKEGKALGILYNELTAAGVPTEEVNTLICLKMADDEDKIQVAFAPGCFPGGQTQFSVAVDPANVNIPPAVPVAAPAQP